jgi:hypothetical protein
VFPGHMQFFPLVLSARLRVLLVFLFLRSTDVI